MITISYSVLIAALATLGYIGWMISISLQGQGRFHANKVRYIVPTLFYCIFWIAFLIVRH